MKINNVNRKTYDKYTQLIQTKICECSRLICVNVYIYIYITVLLAIPSRSDYIQQNLLK